ncbi:hypothetical protein BDZ88DRAFT_413120 [Geranomyces variabilis]|nr:hypothetical protein BDZ88DRAFT_413120 [Geranomyces variabilis]
MNSRLSMMSWHICRPLASVLCQRLVLRKALALHGGANHDIYIALVQERRARSPARAVTRVHARACALRLLQLPICSHTIPISGDRVTCMLCMCGERVTGGRRRR